MDIGWLNDCFGHQSHSMSSFGFLQWKPGYKIFFLNFNSTNFYAYLNIFSFYNDAGKMVKKQQGATNTCNYRSFRNLTWKYFSWFLVIFLCLFNQRFFALLKIVLTIIFTSIVTWWQEPDASIFFPNKVTKTVNMFSTKYKPR